MNVNFRKMDGAGNDFVIFDIRGNAQWLPLIVSNVATVAARRHPVTKGCDQVIVIDGADAGADVRMRIFNPDGEEVGACGNATRCVGWLVMQQSRASQLRVQVSDRILLCENAGEIQVRVDMGTPSFAAKDLHLADESTDTLSLPIAEGGFSEPAGVSMGNPHMVFFVPRLADVNLPEIGPKLEAHPLYTQRANISFVEVVSPSELKVAVWERGAGITQACGTAACAVGIAAARRGLAGRDVRIHMPGGELRVEWREQNGHVYMTGPVCDHGGGVVSL